MEIFIDFLVFVCNLLAKDPFLFNIDIESEYDQELKVYVIQYEFQYSVHSVNIYTEIPFHLPFQDNKYY